ncbi:sensor histidine kinase [Hymenobacter chitinivorans]|uniref:Sensor histidine kinase YesM n=1 Tax=Hymenobacter chitinivorans DSM 11115 TaxID=1121954 RepID=A0A2M9BSM9_9BACT|nr:sensor histidine kinase [Hymenobacter chitinivorans]PJJ60955.1 sensor histidine kinase YesM [Hymenobacter chitinivorans DSM 11115]
MMAWLQHRVVRHGVFWVGVMLTCLLIQLPAYWLAGARLYGWGLVFNQLPAALLVTYPLLYWVLPRLLRQRQLSLFLLLLAGWVVASALVSIGTDLFFNQVVLPGLFHAPPALSAHRTSYWSLNYTFFMNLVTAGGAVAIKVVNNWYEQRRLSQQLEQQRLRTELELLKAQLQPAFLFVTLGTLSTLTRRKAPESAGAVLSLAGLLRYMLYAGPQDTVLLADEVAMLRDYVALEQLRLGGRVEVSLSVSGPQQAYALAPLLLLPLLENAFKHGVAEPVECPWISIDLVVKNNRLAVKIINSHEPPPGGWQPGPGLTALRQRLERLYPGRHELKLLADPDTFFVVLHLPLTPVSDRANVPAPPLVSAAPRPAFFPA